MDYRRWLVGILVVAAVTGAYLAGRAGSRGVDPTPAVPVHAEEGPGEAITLSAEAERRMGLRLAAAALRTMERTIQATGVVQFDETGHAHLRTMAHGRIDEVYVRLGERVAAGQRLFQYDNVELGAAIGQYLGALAELERATSEAEVARRAMERAEALVGRGAMAKAELERRQAEYRNAMAVIESQKAAAADVEQRLHRFGMSDPQIGQLNLRTDYHREASHTTVTSPLAGAITQLDAVAGEPVTPEDLLVTVSDLSTVWVQADVYEKDISAVRPGAPVTVSVAAYPGRTFPGRITYVGDVLDPATRTAKVRCEVGNREGLLKLEMFATVNIPSGSGRAAVAVPTEAVQTLEGQPVVFVPAPGGGYLRRPLALGQQAEGWFEVLEGLQAGDQVVTQGSFVLKSEALKTELVHEH